jgi:hypothetical protein
VTCQYRKAQIKKIVVIIVVVVTLIILIGLLKPILEILFMSVDDAACQQSIRTHMLAASIGGDPPPIECPTNYKTVDEDDPEKINKIFAEEMRKCWNTWGKGEKVIFANEPGYENKNMIYCHVCSVLEFENSGIVVEGFADYLKENMAPGTSMSYYTYLKPKAGEGAIVDDPLAIDPRPFNTNNKYAIIFSEQKFLKAEEAHRREVEPTPEFILGAYETVVNFYIGVFGLESYEVNHLIAVTTYDNYMGNYCTEAPVKQSFGNT